jgi:hypothetical protein
MLKQGAKGSEASLRPSLGFVRTTQTFILRSLVDPDEPDTLRSALQPVPEGEPQLFVGERELLALLHRPVGHAAAVRHREVVEQGGNAGAKT